MPTLSSLLISTAQTAHERVPLSEFDWEQAAVVVDRDTMEGYEGLSDILKNLPVFFSYTSDHLWQHTSLADFQSPKDPVKTLPEPHKSPYKELCIDILHRLPKTTMVVMINSGLRLWPAELPCSVLCVVPNVLCLDIAQQGTAQTLLQNTSLRVALWS